MIKALNRDAILNAAEHLMKNNPKGIDGVTMDDIAKAAEFTKRTVYQYFLSKEEIHFAIMIRGHEGMIASLNKAIHDQQTGLERLLEAGKALYQYSQDEPLRFWAVMAYENQESDFKVSQSLIEELYRLGEISMGMLIDTIKRGKEDGSMLPNLDETTTAFVIWSFLLGVLNTAKTKKNYMTYMHKIDLDSWINDALMHMINTVRKG